MHSALKEATSGEVDRVTCLRDRDGRTRVRRQESGRAQGGGDIHIEYKNNRHLNTNNCKVLQVLTSLKKRERESKEKRGKFCEGLLVCALSWFRGFQELSGLVAALGLREGRRGAGALPRGIQHPVRSPHQSCDSGEGWGREPANQALHGSMNP